MATTIACPINQQHQEINPDTAPIWVDSFGNEYLVASGVIQGEPTEHTVATPEKITIISNMEGLDALFLMGLSPKLDEPIKE